jgi:hypothetical protein
MLYIGRFEMIAWRGLGFIVALFLTSAYYLCRLLIDYTFCEGYFGAHLWGTGISFIVSAIFCALFVWIIRHEAWMEYFAQKTKTHSVTAPEKMHSFIFIPIAYWPTILFLSGAGIYIFDINR